MAPRVIDLKTLSGFKDAYEQRVRAFKEQSLDMSDAANVKNQIREVYSQSTSSDEVIRKAYDAEYRGVRSYAYLSPLLVQEGFEQITGRTHTEACTLRMIDVGAGSNELLRFIRDELHVPVENLVGTDVSEESTRIISTDGFTAHCGRLETLPIPPRSFDIVFLSYFIDYDTNQAGTFDAALRILKPGGRIVLEGLFPVRPFAFLTKDKKTFSFVTRGWSIHGDIKRVENAFSTRALTQGRTATLEHVYKGVRYVRSARYGCKKLPSHFLVFSAS